MGGLPPVSSFKGKVTEKIIDRLVALNYRARVLSRSQGLNSSEPAIPRNLAEIQPEAKNAARGHALIHTTVARREHLLSDVRRQTNRPLAQE